MSKLNKCLYLINLLERKGALTLKEINDYYQYSSLYDGDEIQPRTFLRYKDYIEAPSLAILSSITGLASMNCIGIVPCMVRMIPSIIICSLPITLRA